MVRFSGIRLNLSTIFTYFESLANIFNTRNRQLFTCHIAFTEIDFPQCCLADKLVSKRKLLIIHSIGTGNIMILIYINKELLAVKYIGTLFTFITDQALRIIHIGIYHLNFQHRANLPCICPSRASTLWASCGTSSSLLNLRMRTIRTKSPSCRL